jgi:AcrR family transcriptional regulator
MSITFVKRRTFKLDLIKRLFDNISMESLKKENSKEKILNVAIKLFAEKGFNGTSIREICKAASVNISMISYYWGGKKELYLGIMENLIESQTKFAKTFLDLNSDPSEMSREQQINTLRLIANKMIDFFYSNLTNDLVVFLIKEQQNTKVAPRPPMLVYLKKLIAALLNKSVDDKEVIFKSIFFISQINSPRILPALALNQLGQDEFIQEDINIIKSNVDKYIDKMF